MTNSAQILVLKFGSSVLREESDLPEVVDEISRCWARGYQVIAVVSALGETTNQLLKRAEALCSKPPDAAVAALLATGEAESSALLTLALTRAGIPACVLDATEAGLRTTGSRLDSDLTGVDAVRLIRESSKAVIVLPGFVGRGEQNETTLLGRGGSDLTALFIAQRLQAHCRLVKDVDGLYTSDPADTSLPAFRYSRAAYETAIRVGGSVVQQKAVRFAASHKLTFSISAIGAEAFTEIGPFSDQLAVDQVLSNSPSSDFHAGELLEVSVA